MNEQPGHNSNAQLKSIVDRIERLDEEIKELRDDQKDIYAEAGGNGYDIKILRKVVAIRKKDPAARAEEASLLETYMHALGMDA
jgi:uncharacterized protein (UPF0335 family)